jgi:tetratricopeptide (TPR) repeat protein
VRAVSDDERKKKADERDEDETEGSTDADEADEKESSDDGEDESSDQEEGSEAASAEDEAPSEESDEQEDAAAKRVADALGVGDGEDEAAPAEKTEDEAEEVPVQNRAARRAEAAQRRKKRKAAAPAEDDEVVLPKDKNARAKALLQRRREQAEAAAARPVQLLPGEMVDDALARSASAVGKWLRANFSVLQWVIVGAIVLGGGYAFYVSRSDKTSAQASDTLYAGVRADRGRVVVEDKRSDEEKEGDPTLIFKSAEERADTALASYRKVVKEHPGTGAAILARLGEGGALLDKHDWDKALEAYSTVASSTLAGADPDVKARALEGLGFAKEGKKDYDGATATFKELQGVDGGRWGYKELGQYHEARMLLAKGDKDKAKELLKQLHTALEKPTEGKTMAYLKGVVDETLRRLDPSAVPPKPMIGGTGKGNAMSREEIDRALKKMQETLEKQARENKGHDHGPAPKEKH